MNHRIDITEVINMPFEIVRNDIVKMKVDAIVNTASLYPSGAVSAVRACGAVPIGWKNEIENDRKNRRRER